MNNTLVIVPAAKLVPIELQAEFGPISPAMIPLDGRPALHYIIDQYPDVDFSVAVHEAGEDVVAYCARHIEHREVIVVDIGETKSLGETVLLALNNLKELPERLVINFADTAFPGVQIINDSIHYAYQDDVYRWTTFTTDVSGRINGINEKETEKLDDLCSQKVFIGIFCFSNPQKFRDLLLECVDLSSEIDPFYEALRGYVKQVECSLIETQDWHDFGHLDTYYESRKRLAEVCREFNSVVVDSVRGRITKKSRNTDKFIDEIQWYLKLPRQLQYIAPRVFCYDLDYCNPSVDMEFYGYPVLNDLYLYGHLDLGAWSQIFKSIERVFQDMAQFQVIPENPEDIRSAMREMYENKTLQRMALYKDQPRFSWAKTSSATVNGTPILSLNEVIDYLPKTLEKAGVYDSVNFCIVHGDPCFSNILYDRRNGIVRLIDPRGSFGSYDIYGDSRYDACKLSHSVNGDYDFFVNGLFDLKIEGNCVEFEPHLTERQHAVKQLYRDRLIRRLGKEEVARIRLLESLLFLSMIPLHSDRTQSQQVFLAKGLQLFSELHKQL